MLEVRQPLPTLHCRGRGRYFLQRLVVKAAKVMNDVPVPRVGRFSNSSMGCVIKNRLTKSVLNCATLIMRAVIICSRASLSCAGPSLAVPDPQHSHRAQDGLSTSCDSHAGSSCTSACTSAYCGAPGPGAHSGRPLAGQSACTACRCKGTSSGCSAAGALRRTGAEDVDVAHGRHASKEHIEGWTSAALGCRNSWHD